MTAEVLVEAEAFAERGGWLLDPQFMDQMGSPYLLAHGLGKPVANAKTEIEFPAAGRYHVWVRAKDWVPTHHPGRFRVLVGKRTLEPTFGDHQWQSGAHDTTRKYGNAGPTGHQRATLTPSRRPPPHNRPRPSPLPPIARV